MPTPSKAKTPALQAAHAALSMRKGTAITPPAYAVNMADQPFIQAQLLVGDAHDPLEREADKAGERAVSVWQSGRVGTGAPAVQTATSPVGLQRQSSAPSHSPIAASPAVTQQIEAARGGGLPLSEPMRSPLESAFGTDFSGVRVHTDARADALNRSLSARAFATGTTEGVGNPMSWRKTEKSSCIVLSGHFPINPFLGM